MGGRIYTGRLGCHVFVSGQNDSENQSYRAIPCADIELSRLLHMELYHIFNTTYKGWLRTKSCGIIAERKENVWPLRQAESPWSLASTNSCRHQGEVFVKFKYRVNFGTEGTSSTGLQDESNTRETSRTQSVIGKALRSKILTTKLD